MQIEIKETAEKIDYLYKQEIVQAYLKDAVPIRKYLHQASPNVQVALLSVIAIGEGPVVFRGWKHEKHLNKRLDSLAGALCKVEAFYDTLGGIIGYHETVLRLMQEGEKDSVSYEQYDKPPGVDISEVTSQVSEMIRWGVECLPQMAEIYPVGGAGDRLNLIDEKTQTPLPAAELKFAGKTLIEQLIQDIEAREHLYLKITGKRIITPIVLMTSHEKDNDRLIRQICEAHEWFGRTKDNFFFVVQPLVPVITETGHWVMRDSFDLHLKPGGHGVLWKLMEDQGAFDWLKGKRRTKALLRQINNPIAGVDYGLLAFTGIGCKQDKVFGFASCPRVLNASEGMDVLVEKQDDKGYLYGISNVEYTDFAKKGIEDSPEEEGSVYSQFPANTNLLFVDLEAVRSHVPSCPVPGMLVNFKNRVDYIDSQGKKQSLPGSRLESTMQNIADEIVFRTTEPLSETMLDKLPTFLTYNKRDKTICVTKRSFDSEKPLSETPEGCFYVLQSLYRNLLEKSCYIKVPLMVSGKEYLESGPETIFLFHPSLGPLYSIIGQKIQGGSLARGSELQIEIPEIEIKNIELNGSLLIRGDAERGRCTLKDVIIRNKGIDRKQSCEYWRNTAKREEVLEIILEGNSEFVAEGVVLSGSMQLFVPDGYRFTAIRGQGNVEIKKEKISKPMWSWNYIWTKSNEVAVSRYPNTAS